MNFTHDFGVVGGDLRQVHLANLLTEEGFSVLTYAVETCDNTDSLRSIIENASALIAPLPLTKDKKTIFSKTSDDIDIKEFFGLLKEGQIIFAGNIPQKLTAQCEESGILYYDFMKNEELAMYNAIATAEGTIAEAIRHHPTNLHKSPAIVLGYGTCAKVLAEKLKGLSVNVSICARSAAQRMEARTFGYHAIDFDELTTQIETAEFIFNTVPARVLTRKILNQVKKDAIIIDIASMPGGVDKEAVNELGLHTEHCLALPGIYAPKSSAGYLKEVVLSVMSERKGRSICR